MLNPQITAPWLPMAPPPDRVVAFAMSRIRNGAENEIRKDFTPSERVAILGAIETKPIGSNQYGGPQNIATLDDAAKQAGFGNERTARQAKEKNHAQP